MLTRLPARHVHLDFHTSEHISGIGRRFSKRQFQKALKLGRVNHITVFAKCHHAWCYYPTKVGHVHPNLKFDLLGRQIEACREIGVRVPIYLTVGWSAADAAAHPEWCAMKADGTPAAFNVDPKAKPDDRRPGCSWTTLCINTEYRHLVVEHVGELAERYHVDGIFFDICFLAACWCGTCRAGMAADAVDAADVAAATRWYTGRWRAFMEECSAALHARHPEATAFYNGRADVTTPPELLAMQTHLELEDLPTTWGGYDRFPLRARFFARHAKPMLAMSGKFHTSWGEFGGFKHPDAMRYEAAGMIAYGAACSFGDQMHPSGEMDLETYRQIGEAYKYVEAIEDYGLDARPHANLALYVCGQTPHDQGVANMLMEGHVDFEVISSDPVHNTGGTGGAADWPRYQTIVLAGGACLDAAAAQRLGAYVRAGGSVLALHESALDARKQRFLLDVGAKYVGPPRFELDYLSVKGPEAKSLVTSPFLCYSAALRVKPTPGTTRGAKVLAAIHEPYFDRTYARYCSHLNTPNQPHPAKHPGAIQNGRTIYLPHALGAMYHQHGARLHRDFFLAMLRRLHRTPLLEVTLPSAGRATLVHQPQHRRYVVHLLYAPPLQRGRCLVIEDLPVLRDVRVGVRVQEKIRRAHLAAGGKKLPTRVTQGQLRLTVPEFQCHAALVLEY